MRRLFAAGIALLFVTASAFAEGDLKGVPTTNNEDRIMDNAAQVKTYPPPGEEDASDDYAVSVNGKPVFVYRARVSAVPHNQVWPGYQRPLDQTEIASFAYWDMSGPVTVEVVSKRPFNRVAIRPTSYGIQPAVEDRKITFQMLCPGQITVELDGPHYALHLFADPLEEDAPNPDDPDILYFGPGVHRPGKIMLKTGQTVYIAGGAVVHTSIRGAGVSNISVLGRGIVDTSTFERQEGGGGISLHNCDNVKIDGVIFRDPNVWTVTPRGCRNIAISNIKLIGLWRYNADGIDIVNCQHVTINKCFVRSFDDSIVIKGLKGTGDQPVQDVVVTGCVIWNDWGRALEIGAETVAPEISRLVFRNCDIIRTVHVAIDIQHGDRARVRDILFENIRFEIDDYTPRPQYQNTRDEKYSSTEDDTYCPRFLVLEIKKTNYSQDSERGSMQDIYVRDVVVNGKLIPESHIYGYDATHKTEDVTIENLRINGQLISNAEEGNFHIREHASNVTFITEKGAD
ncbi:glycosyl hydrolase family 28 protein [Candidatus Poribacteria bacterium]